jgi:hypothetical protein
MAPSEDGITIAQLGKSWFTKEKNVGQRENSSNWPRKNGNPTVKIAGTTCRTHESMA